MIPPKRVVITILSVLLLSFLLGSVLMSLILIIWQSSSSGGEDSWVCSGGQWVSHGKPLVPKPTHPCDPATPVSQIAARSSLEYSPFVQSDSSPPQVQRDLFGDNSVPSIIPFTDTRGEEINPFIRTSTVSSESPHLSDKPAPGSIPDNNIFQSEDFSMSYPPWKAIEKIALLEPYLTKVAVTSHGCALVLTVRALPQNIEFQSFMEQLIIDQASRAQVTLLRKDIGSVTMHIEGQFPVGSRIAYTDQYGFLTSRKQFYSLVFVAEKEVFSDACVPFVDWVVKSIAVL